ncbi:MAG: hypothetical protein QXP36_07925 [Conexivisphaerales archaeon]
MAADSTQITYKPLGITHVLIAAIFAISTLGINAVEFYFLAKNGGLTSTSLNLFWIVLQNVGIAIPNSYYLSKIKITTGGITESTQK